MMKKVFITFLIFAAGTSVTLANNLFMGFEAKKYKKQTQQELNQVYKNINRAFSDDKIFLKRLKTNHQQWLNYQQSYINTIFPEDAEHAKDISGKSYQIYLNHKTSDLNMERIDELKTIVTTRCKYKTKKYGRACYPENIAKLFDLSK